MYKICNYDVNILITSFKHAETLEKCNITQLIRDISPLLYTFHINNFAHMDLKPENILYCESAPVEYKIADISLISTISPKIFSYTELYLLPYLKYNTKKN